MPRPYRRPALVAVATLAAAALGVVTAAAPAGAGTVTHRVVVNSDPLDATPNIENGTVWDVVRIGPHEYIAGGTFTAASEAGSDEVLSRQHIIEFNARTGHIDRSFRPNVGGPVYALWPSLDGHAVFVGGSFGEVNGRSAPHLARLDINTGRATPRFHPPSLDGRVRDLTIFHGKLVVAGTFKHVGGRTQHGLVAMGGSTGAVRPFFAGIDIEGVHSERNGGRTEVFDMDATADGDRMVMVGNFATVNGQPRNEVAMLATGGSSAQLVDWRAPQYETRCGRHFNAPIRDVSFAPSGSYFVIVSTGGAYPYSLCDAAARFETSGRGTVAPTWTNFTGGDALMAVEVTGAAVYVGGHMRWVSNPFGRDYPGPGAVPRKGIAALKPATGDPYSWNPGHRRGVGVRVLRAEPDSLWLGADTNRTGHEYHGKIAAFPTAGGTAP